MIDWDSILYGAALSGLAAAGLLLLTRERRLAVLASAAIAALVGPIGWNAVLRATHADEFFTDAPISVLPASWQDTGSGVVTIAVASLMLGFGALRGEPAVQAARVAVLAGLAAFVVDVYLY